MVGVGSALLGPSGGSGTGVGRLLMLPGGRSDSGVYVGDGVSVGLGVAVSVVGEEHAVASARRAAAIRILAVILSRYSVLPGWLNCLAFLFRLAVAIRFPPLFSDFLGKSMASPYSVFAGCCGPWWGRRCVSTASPLLPVCGFVRCTSDTGGYFVAALRGRSRRTVPCGRTRTSLTAR